MEGSSFERAEERLADTAWVRRLALALVGDPHRAEDLAQEAWLASLTGGAAEGVPRRAWLAGVLRNLARKGRRTEARRRGREERAARPEADDSARGLRERAELHRELVGAVLSLEEPYRSTLLLRYLDGVPPRAIARRLGVSAATVSSRLQRGLERLRERLDRERGGREAWLPGAGGLAAGAAVERGGMLGGILMGAKGSAAIAAAVAAAAVVIAVRWTGHGDAEMSAPPERIALQEGDGSGAAPLAPLATAEQRVAVEEEPAVAAAAPAAAAGRIVLRGRLVDGACPEVGLAEAPVERAQVRVWAGAKRMEQPPPSPGLELEARGGAFAVELDDPGYRPLHLLVRAAEGPGHRQGLAACELAAGEHAADVLVVRPPHGVLHGRVRDGAGAPLAGAQVRAPVLRKGVPPATALTGEDGAFALYAEDGVGRPTAERAGWVVVEASGGRKLPEGGYEDAEIVLAPAGALVVHVQDPGGRPLRRFVGLMLAPEELSARGRPGSYPPAEALRSARSDERGTAVFEQVWTGRKLHVLTGDDSSALFDRVDGARLCRVGEERGRAIVLEPGGALEVELVLGREILVRGTVALSDGSPVPAPWIQLGTAEPPFAGPSNGLDARRGSPEGRFEMRVDEELVQRGSWLFAADGKVGAPRFGGGDFGHAACVRLDPTDARADGAGERVLELDLCLEPAGSISGTLADETGKPFARHVCRVCAVPAGAGRSDAPTAWGTREGSVDADGRFRIERLPPGLYDVIALRGHPSVLAGSCTGMVRVPGVPAGTSGLELVLPREGGVRVRLALEGGGEPPDSLTVTVGWVEPPDLRPAPAESPALIRGTAGRSATGLLGPADASEDAPKDWGRRFEVYATSEVNGHAVHDLGEGWYVFGIVPRRAGAISHVPMGTEPVYLRPGDRVVRFALAEANELAGRVVSDGPVAHLAAALADEHGELLSALGGFRHGARTSPLDAAGGFFFDSAPVGKARLRVGTAEQLLRGEFLRELEVEVAPRGAEIAPLEIRL